MKAVPRSIKSVKASITEICMCFGLTRDAYYKFFKRRKNRIIIHKGIETGQRRTQRPAKGRRQKVV